MLSDVTAVALGGAIGAVLRFSAGAASRALLGTGFPFATLFVNTLGSFLIAVVVTRIVDADLGSRSMLAHPFLVVGVLGAFTTFSTFSLETVTLLHAGEFGKAGLNVAANVVLCLAACAAGFVVARGV